MTYNRVRVSTWWSPAHLKNVENIKHRGLTAISSAHYPPRFNHVNQVLYSAVKSNPFKSRSFIQWMPSQYTSRRKRNIVALWRWTLTVSCMSHAFFPSSTGKISFHLQTFTWSFMLKRIFPYHRAWITPSHQTSHEAAHSRRKPKDAWLRLGKKGSAKGDWS